METVIDELMDSPRTAGSCPPSTDFPSERIGFIDNPERCREQCGDGGPLGQSLQKALYELALGIPELAHVQTLRIWFDRQGNQPDRLRILIADLPAQLGREIQLPLDDAIANWVWEHRRPLMITAGSDTRFPEFANSLLNGGVKYFHALPLISGDRFVGILGFASTKREPMGSLNLDSVQPSLHLIKGIIGCEDSRQSEVEINEISGADTFPQKSFEGIIGRCRAIRALCNQIEVVAPTNSTVLILGETGTGKELIANAIHNLSPRRDRPFVKMNCAAIPAGLIESELFGHERGAFTGAVDRRIGRFEMANGGTLFLDEIGDIPLELQPKLLRVLQQQEFERIGSTRTIRVDVRIVAATSRDLPQMVDSKEFRADLYYRLNVFPLRIPALRERPGDIILLAQHFVALYAKQMNKPVHRISPEMMEVLSRYHWPGNIRELQNVIERAVILSPGTVLQLPVEDLRPSFTASGEIWSNDWTTLKEMERAHILRALKTSNWVLGGPAGAGARLGLARTTLIAKMHKLGIFRQPSQKIKGSP